MLYPLSYGRVLGVKCLVYRDLLVVALFVVAICREARRRLDCNRIATRSIKPLHLLLQTDPDRVQVRVRLIESLATAKRRRSSPGSFSFPSLSRTSATSRRDRCAIFVRFSVEPAVIGLRARYLLFDRPSKRRSEHLYILIPSRCRASARAGD